MRILAIFIRVFNEPVLEIITKNEVNEDGNVIYFFIHDDWK